MRPTLSALAFLTTTLAMSAGAQAEITYPWCITGSYSCGARSCMFTSLAQCNASNHSGGSYCEPNPMYQPGNDFSAPRRSRR